MYRRTHGVLSHHTQSCGSVQSVDQRNAQDSLTALPRIEGREEGSDIQCNVLFDRVAVVLHRRNGYETNLVMSKPFVDLQSFIVGRNFIVKEIAVLRDVFILSYYSFAHSVPWYSFTKAKR